MREKPLSVVPEEERWIVPEERAEQSSMPATLADLNRVIHEPARLAILTVLSGCVSTDFTFLQTATGLSKGNLSVQLTRLEEAGLVAITKTIVRKRTLTMVSLTKDGRSELARYWRQMERIRTHAARVVEAVALKVERVGGVGGSEEILSS
jgi:DNA-binding transcriptional ArsR family regulator